MKTTEIYDKCFYIIGWMGIGALTVLWIIWKAGFLGGITIPPCTLHSITGYYCPGCGGTRAVYALFQGKFLTSLFYQPFILYTAVIGGWFMVSQTIERCSRGKIHIGMHFRPIWAYIGIGIIFLNCIVKNLFILVADVHLM